MIIFTNNDQDFKNSFNFKRKDFAICDEIERFELNGNETYLKHPLFITCDIENAENLDFLQSIEKKHNAIILGFFIPQTKLEKMKIDELALYFLKEHLYFLEYVRKNNPNTPIVLQDNFTQNVFKNHSATDRIFQYKCDDELAIHRINALAEITQKDFLRAQNLITSQEMRKNLIKEIEQTKQELQKLSQNLRNAEQKLLKKEQELEMAWAQRT